MVRGRRCWDQTCARPLSVLCLVIWATLVAPGLVSAADLAELRKLLHSGQYDECIQQARVEIEERNVYGEGYRVVKAEAEFARGRYADAVKTVDDGLKRYSWSIALRWIGYHANLHNGDTDRAADMIRQIDKLYETQSWRYSDADDLVTLGRVALLVGADPRIVLENFFDRAKRNSPDQRIGYLAAGRMALDKNDYQLAADLFSAALKRFPTDADLLYGLGKAIASGDAEASQKLFQQALEANPNHIPTILLQTDRLISSERYADAEKNLAGVLKINPKHPEAWAYRAVIAHLQSDHDREAECRTKALSTWSENPAVDHLIGAKLSRQYRFAVGAEYQRRALEFDKTYLPAQIQLSQDLLRLGKEAEGWALAEAAHKADGYDTTTFNLLSLRDHMAKFRTVENEHFIVRMSAAEAGIYGDRVVRLLERARSRLTEKYGLNLQDKVTVEIFPEENDFAVRTFGMPAVSGFLGVCFGKVITANSPASQQDSPNNWESVLWHEFCHVVTLSLTNNKMPRWLSEGISVYEETLENPAWGMAMHPQFRQWIIDGEMLPVRELTRAFMNTPTPLHVQFAYFQSSLVVEYIVQEHGIDALRNILTDLGNGVAINDAINRRTQGLDDFEEGFVAFAQQKAADLAPNVDWETPARDVLSDPVNLAQFVREHPNNYAALRASVAMLINGKQWDQAEELLKRLIEIYPEDVSSSNARELLARLYRQRNQTELELEVLEDYAAISSDASDSYARLAELRARQSDHSGVVDATDRVIAVNPLMKAPWKLRAEAAERLDRPQEAIEAWRALLVLEPEDPALVHYRLARLLHASGDPLAKRHVLQALEEAPRYRDAHRLLLEIVAPSKKTSLDDTTTVGAGSGDSEAADDR